ncbi:Undecaprenyl-diphosphatase [uncultured archaeon]|nr:Undecaprenyl-diphosphatase [uncultured archaeon]
MRSKYILFFVIVIIAMFVLVIHNGQGPMLGSLDVAMFHAINQDMQSPVLNRIAATASDIGSNDTNIFMYLFFLSSIILLISIICKNRELKKIAIILLIAVVISGLILGPLKTIFGVSRPYVYLNNVHVYSDGRWLDTIEQSDNRDSFPSGHAAITFTVLGVLWMYNRLRIPLLIFILIIMFLIVYVGQHYISDIIAGGFIGFMIGYLVRRSFV